MSVELVRGISAAYFVVAVVLMVLLSITGRRFYSAYLDRYGGPDGRRQMWQPWRWSPRRGPWSLESWFRRVDDPLVERRRRQHLLAWGGIALYFAIPVALIVLSFVRQ
jgi:hypothetical protein